jgi:hypothetical protein
LKSAAPPNTAAAGHFLRRKRTISSAMAKAMMTKRI